MYTSSLADRITKKSEGVFLWVTLVVSSLLSGITDGDQPVDLDTRLDALPTDLEELFHKMLRSMSRSHKHQACRLFILFRFWNDAPQTIPWTLKNREGVYKNYRDEIGELTLMQMYLADSNDLESVLRAPIRRYPSEVIESKSERMRRRLNSRCKGLLECRGHGYHERVYWLHRTVADFMYRLDIWNWIVQDAGGDTFRPDVIYCSSLLHQLKRLPWHGSWNPGFILMVVVLLAKFSVRTSNGLTTHSLISIIDELDESIRVLIRTQLKNSSIRRTTEEPCLQIDDLVGIGHNWARYAADFFNIAVHEEMDWYVQEKMKEKKLPKLHPSASPPLLCAMRHCHTYPGGLAMSNIRPSPDIHMVEVLLKNGQNPNQTIKGNALISLIDRKIESGSIGKKDWLKVRKLLMKYGAEEKSGAKENRRLKRKIFFGICGRF